MPPRRYPARPRRYLASRLHPADQRPAQRPDRPARRQRRTGPRRYRRLLGLAKNKLSTADYSQLAKTVPGLDKLTGSNALGGLGGQLGNLGGGASSGLLGNVSSMGDVSKAFGALGMDQDMTGKFSSVLLDYLGKQGANSNLLGTLGSLWGTGA